MTNSSASLQKLILDSHALSIWNHKTGPVFWYAAGVPGPFYLNTELMIGRNLAEYLLAGITAIIADQGDAAARAALLQRLIMDAYRHNADYQLVIKAMIEKTGAEFPAGSFAAISGGERRDWLFSIPLAEELGVQHLYLFKNRSTYGDPMPVAGSKILHVSDLINNAASYFDLWLPILQQAGLVFAGTLTVNTRGSAGVNRMAGAGHKVVALNRVDLRFFEGLQQSGLIDQATLDEIAVYFTSPAAWAERYLMGNEKLFAVDAKDEKSRTRMTWFFTEDPWKLRAKHTEFFHVMCR